MSLSSHNLETVYRKMCLRASILPAEILLVVKDFMIRINTLEEEVNELKEEMHDRTARVEETSKARQRVSRVSSEEVSTD